MQKKILLLGGTAEASLCIRAFTEHQTIQVILSLAGITKNPTLPPNVMTRIGGFGGVIKMAEWIKEHHIDAVIDATHPFAQQITKNAYQATKMANISFLRLERPAWRKREGDLWNEVLSVQDAVVALGKKPLRIFITIGRKELLPFKECCVSHQYWIRSVDRPDELYIPNNSQLIQAKGPFSEEDEIAFLKQHRIECIVSKNSGGQTVYAKIKAARTLGIPVFLIQRPYMEPMPCVHTWQEAYQWGIEMAGYKPNMDNDG